MGNSARAVALAAALVMTAGQAIAAADWAPAATSADGIVYDTDLSSVSLNGQVAKSWMRQTFPKAQRDPKTGLSFTIGLQERFDDCQNHRFMLGSYVERDASGRTAGEGPGDLASGWRDISPGSVAEGVARTVCAVAYPPKEDPIQADLREGSWTDLGGSKDGKFRLQVRIDGVMKVGDGGALAISRSIYEKPEWIDGLPVRIIVSATAIDCERNQSAALGADFFASPGVRVKSMRVEKKDIRFERSAPGSFLAASIKLICASAKTEAAAGSDDEHAGGLSVGTAWGVNKGYLVTASHVVEGGARIEVYDNGEKVGEARVVADDPANDLAILKFKPSKPGKLAILPIAPKTPNLGRSVFVLGYPAPDSLGQRIKMTAGEVSSTAGYQDDARFLQISVPIQQGNSGGPVIAWDGTVVGVVESKLTRFGDRKDELAPEAVNYAIKASYIRPMLEDLPDLANYTVVKPTGGNDDLVAAARKAVYMVVVSPPGDG